MIYRREQLEESIRMKNYSLESFIIYWENVSRLILIVHISDIKKDIDSYT